MPLSVGKETVVFPGFDGGAEWGGPAFDPETGLLYVNANEMAWTGGLAPNDAAGERPAALPADTAPTATATTARRAAADPVACRHRREADDRPTIAHGDPRRRRPHARLPDAVAGGA